MELTYFLKPFLLLAACLMLSTGCGPAAEIKLGLASPMERVTSKRDRFAYRGGAADGHRLFAARNERESFQLIVLAGSEALQGVRLEASDLRGPEGTIPAAAVTWEIVGAVNTGPTPIADRVDHYYDLAGFTPEHEVDRIATGWTVDPLVVRDKFDVAAGDYQALWITVYVPPATRAGRYEGTLRVLAEKTPAAAFALSLDVWPFTLPTQGHHRAPGTLGLESIPRFYGEPMSAEVRRLWLKILLDHRIDPTSLYARGLHPLPEDIDYCVERGIRMLVLGGEHYSEQVREPERALAGYRVLKERGLLDLGVIYLADEPFEKDYPALKRKVEWARENLPGLKIMAGSSPRAGFEDLIDVWDPQIIGFGLNHYREKVCRERQAAGDEVLWYVCAGPPPPYPNVHVDNPLIDARLEFWLSWRFDITGWEYYGVNLWGRNRPGWWEHLGAEDPGAWDPNTYTNRNTGERFNGDGQLLYPGPKMVPWSCVRLANVRDGIEDYETLAYLRDRLSTLRRAAPEDALLSELSPLLTVPGDLINDDPHKGPPARNDPEQQQKDPVYWAASFDPETEQLFRYRTRDPEVVQGRRREVAEGIVRLNERLRELGDKLAAGEKREPEETGDWTCPPALAIDTHYLKMIRSSGDW